MQQVRRGALSDGRGHAATARADSLRHKEIVMFKRVFIATAIAATFGAALPAPAAADVFVRIAPPPRHGYVWVPGYWDWRGNRHAWVGGHWVRERPGYVYYSPRWVERGGGWYMEAGRWGRGDRDSDGIPNRFDRDRDNDGVPNRVDRHPDNPRRY
jgi:hypothetical protein